MKIALLGGTFNPIHIGHLILAQEAWHQLELDKVVFVPAYMPPHKQIDGAVAPGDRLNMVCLALEGVPYCAISTCEIDQRKVCYTIDTIRYFKKNSDEEYFFIAGADAAEDISSWKDHDALLDETKFVIATRGDVKKDRSREKRFINIDIPRIDISSSSIRERIRLEQPIDFFVPRKVLLYIRNKGLYK